MFASKDVFLKSTGGYTIARSVRLRSSASAYLSKTPTVSGNTTTFTYSVWAKRGSLSSIQYLFWGGNNCTFGFGVVGTDELGGNLRGTGATNYFWNTSGVFRDPSAWYHIVWAVDTTQATDTNRLKVYVNGVQQTLSATYCPQNTAQLSTAQRNIGSESGRYYYDGYLAEINFIDGQALTPSSFGAISTNGVWQPARYTGTYGTNGFYLNFSDNSAATAAAIGKDSSGNGNNWTPNGINLTTPASTNTNWDSMTDVPMLTSASAANYAVLNPLSIMGSGNSLTNGNLTFAGNGSTNIITTGTFGMSSGKWYVEATMTNGSGGVGFGIAKYTEPRGTGTVGNTSNTWGYNGVNGVIANNSSTLSTGATYTTGDVVAFALDMDAGTLVFYKNNVSQGSTVTGLSGIFLVAVSGYLSTVNLNFGQRPFTYTAPTGFVALNTYNLSTPTIANGAAYMAATLYTGNGSTQSITNTVNSVSFQPDWVWIKNRSVASSNDVFDVLRGATKSLITNLTNAETTDVNGLTAFNSNGFSVGSTASDNGNGNSLVGWQWKANGAGVSNTSGSITSTVSAGTTQGFSVVTYTGTGANATVGHGLGVAPVMVIVKCRSNAANWTVGSSYLTSWAYFLQLSSTIAQTLAAAEFNSTAPTSSVFSVGTDTDTNGSARTYVAYCFAAVAGYSAFGSYTGNGSTDGPFVYLGFRPRWVMVKRTDSTSDWYIWDTSRDTYNVVAATLFSDTSGAETSATSIDDLSNGFKCRSATVVNVSTGTYIYACFAENPFKYSLAR